ncbi:MULTISPECIES: nuclear transport factor 2 family protein [Pseudoalteromonas]|uniref:Nuclear transport factor 2 family protein n=1 Tax=Pseudoalteromonas obscura TaxID=3048491 RepID=A0ABT7EQW3_9GAMM|nr:MULTISPECIES: nuclear transport factor 2 family protein [Pseudoalteromonas]MBQ4835100.1 nuclear transport factor 2 family protein [Pseudoalteromonas luteoviolacea]MDK2597393.1 nuclear transport factor 2 family protein [Pseudoalteromonas sp. P94(2023)]
MEQHLSNFVDIYNQLSDKNLNLLRSIYDDSIVFSDPLHKVEGIEDLTKYFENMYANVNSISFDIKEHYVIDDKGFLYWDMHFSHNKLNNRKSITVAGHSQLTFKGEKVINHRDYFDVGALLYRNIPLLGSVIKTLEKRAVS